MKKILFILILCLCSTTCPGAHWKTYGSLTSRNIPTLRRHIIGPKYENPCGTFPTTRPKWHTNPWIKHETDSNGWGCFYYTCIDGYGFKSTNDKSCIKCPDNVNESTGICGDCPSGTIPGDIISGCIDKQSMKTYTKEQLKECYIFTNPPDYQVCVMGCPDGYVRKSNLRFKSDGRTPNPDYVLCIQTEKNE